MPEYLAPGILVEELSSPPKPIEGVHTSTTGLVGPTRFGPVVGLPPIVTSLREFEQAYGNSRSLTYSSTVVQNYLWHAARAFFENGGNRLHVVRVFRPLAGVYPPADFSTTLQTTPGFYDDGHARADIGNPNEPTHTLTLRARFPGSDGNLRVKLTLTRGRNLLAQTGQAPTLKALANHDVVWIGASPAPDSSSGQSGGYYLAEFDEIERTWRFMTGETKSETDLRLHHTDPQLSLSPARGTQVRVISLTITVLNHDSTPSVWERIPLDPHHQRHGTPDSLLARFADVLDRSHNYPIPPLIVTHGQAKPTGLDVLAALTAHKPLITISLKKRQSTVAARSVDLVLDGGNDGQRPTADDYRGTIHEASRQPTALRALEAIDKISIVATPGSTFGMERDRREDALAIAKMLIAHTEQMRDRIAVLDSGDGQNLAQVRALRTQVSSNYAALYYPWVRTLDPTTNSEILLPPSGFVAGIYARNDRERGVYKAPANEVVIGAIGIETQLTQHEQDLLNPEGVNCFRFFEGRGFRLWGARTTSSDPEWRYVNVRRYLIYLEHSMTRGTEWAVFEPNGDALWTTLRRMVENFLVTEWRNGGLLGPTPKEAFFVTCDRSTMTQDDLDNGRLVCLVGVALLKPAEFVLFRIGQWTADHKP